MNVVGTGHRRRLRAAAMREPGPGTDDVSLFDVVMMERAMVLAARAARAGEVPVGAVVYRDRKVLGEAANNREHAEDPTGHAEIVALRRAGRETGSWRLQDCTVVVTLEPCPMCAGAMVNARVGRLVYGASDPKAGACSSLYEITTDSRLNHRPRTIGGLMSDRCGRLLSSFFRERRIERRNRRDGG